jgi:hypothetical protein
MTYSKRNLYEQLVVHHQPVYIFTHALHQQCRLVLHSSLVPQFCGVSLLDSVPVELISVSARVALRSAQSLSELGADLMALDWNFAQVAPFVGYCMYVSASIHIVFLFSQNEALATLARTKLISNVKVLKSMKTYWANLERLVSIAIRFPSLILSSLCASGNGFIFCMKHKPLDLNQHRGRNSLRLQMHKSYLKV